MKQMDLFQWADNRPSNVIDARARFEARVFAFVQQMITTNRLPPNIESKIINPVKFQRERDVA